MCPCVESAAQGGEAVFSGTVTDTGGKAVVNVTCKLLDGKDSLLSYALTRSDGAYKLKATGGGRRIEFAFLGYETLRVLVKEGNTRYDARLERAAVELEDVTVIADPITRRKDTLLYNVDAFRREQDRSIEDVLKRMPGIEVSDEGQISYQGKAVLCRDHLFRRVLCGHKVARGKRAKMQCVICHGTDGKAVFQFNRIKRNGVYGGVHRFGNSCFGENLFHASPYMVSHRQAENFRDAVPSVTFRLAGSVTKAS